MSRSSDQPTASAGRRTTGRRTPQVIGISRRGLRTSRTERRRPIRAASRRASRSIARSVTGLDSRATFRRLNMPSITGTPDRRNPTDQIQRAQSFFHADEEIAKGHGNLR